MIRQSTRSGRRPSGTSGPVQPRSTLSQTLDINAKIKEVIDDHTEPWGAQATAVEIKDITPPEADSITDWSRVNLEAHRQHPIDMNEVTPCIRPSARVRSTGTIRSRSPAKGGLGIDPADDGLAPRCSTGCRDFTAARAVIPNGARLTVRAENPAGRKIIAKLRGLGFIGLLTVGAHHAAHHLALARGDDSAHSHQPDGGRLFGTC